MKEPPCMNEEPIVSGRSGPTERIFNFVDSLLQPIAQKQESYIKDTTHFINFIESNPLPDGAVLATLDVYSLYIMDLMRLILKENSFKFKDKHYIQTHGTAMVTKMAVAFAVIFMAHVEKQPPATSPHKPLIWRKFIDDIFSVCTSPKVEINNFIDFANSFHTTIKFRHEVSSKKIVSLDTEVFQDPRLITDKILDVETHLKPTETFQYTQFSHPLSVKKGFVKGEALRWRINSVNESFELMKKQF